eukprot:2036476-Pyramimonas_sp.AAC.1
MDIPTFHAEVNKFWTAVDHVMDFWKLIARQLVRRNEVLIEASNSNATGELKSAPIELNGASAKHLGKPARVFHGALYQMAESDSANLGRPMHVRHTPQGSDASEYEWDARAA